jgi:hypothetical protein
MPARLPIPLSLLAVAALFACDASGFLQPTAGAIEITTTTSGPPDPDGYTVRIDDQHSVPIGTDTTVTFPAFTSGLHTVSLGGLASGCSVQGDVSRTVAVTQQDTARVTFAVACGQASSRAFLRPAAEVARRHP